MFEDVIGHESIKAYFCKAIERKALHSTFLFSGMAGIGKAFFAKEIAQHLLQTTKERIDTEVHPDFHPIYPEGKSGLHSIETLRKMIDEVHETPFEASQKVFLIHHADRMQPAASNALLKTLEEPSLNTTFILLTEHPNEILPTIHSRCIHFYFQPIPDAEMISFLRQKDLPEHILQRSEGSIGKALDFEKTTRLEEALFTLLQTRPAYPSLLTEIEALEQLAAHEDPVQASQNAEYLFTTLIMWCRDQHIQQQNISQEWLFFPQQRKVSFQLPKLETMIAKIEEASLVHQRNLKLSLCLETIFTELFYGPQ